MPLSSHLATTTMCRPHLSRKLARINVFTGHLFVQKHLCLHDVHMILSIPTLTCIHAMLPFLKSMQAHTQTQIVADPMSQLSKPHRFHICLFCRISSWRNTCGTLVSQVFRKCSAVSVSFTNQRCELKFPTVCITRGSGTLPYEKSEKIMRKRASKAKTNSLFISIWVLSR